MNEKSVRKKLEREYQNLRQEKYSLPASIGSIIILSGESKDPKNVEFAGQRDTEQRLAKGVDLYNSKGNWATKLVLNGTPEQNSWMFGEATRLGVDTKNIIFVDNPEYPQASTLTQISGIKKLKLPQPLLFVTDLWHIPRTKRLIKKWLNTRVYFSTSDNFIDQKTIKLEVEKIIRYAKKGDLSW